MVNTVSKSAQVKELLRKDIAEGKFVLGDKIPIEPELSRLYNVGRSSVREAVSSLVHEGLLDKQQGRGTFVRVSSGPDIHKGKSGRIGLTYGLAPQYIDLMKKCQDRVLDKGSLLTFYDVGEDQQDPAMERKFLEFTHREGFSGVAVYPSPLPPLNTGLYQELRRKGMKIALLMPYAEDGDDQVTFFHDYIRTGYLAAVKMAAAGCKHACLVRLVDHFPLTFRMLRDGMAQAVDDLGLKLEEDIPVAKAADYEDHSFAISSEAFDAIKRLPKKTGILATQNQACLSLKSLLAKTGRKTPGDIGYCVCSDYVNPGLKDVSILLCQAEAALSAAIDYLLDETVDPGERVRKLFHAVFVDNGSL